MKNLPVITLKQGKEHSLKRFHPWVFSGAVKSVDPNLKEGDIVEIFSEKGEYLATAHLQSGSIVAKVFSFQRIVTGYDFWKEKIKHAYLLRRDLGLTESIHTNCYRLVHGEADGIPGLIIDWYNGTAVVQVRSLGIHNIKELIVNALMEIYKSNLNAVYYKSGDLMGKATGLSVEDGYLYGTKTEGIVLENDCRFFINWESGQKTGFFVDQRDNRQLLSTYSKNKTVLNTFSYSGGFSVYALKSGASFVHSVDSSATAIELTEKNTGLNGFNENNHKSYVADVKTFLNNTDSEYDIIILDPPAFAKNIKNRHHAVIGYKNLNLLAMKKIKKGGLLFTFSCSQAIDRSLFTSTVTAAALESGRNMVILHHLSQPPDHPVSIYHPEGEYLKGLVLKFD